MQPSTARPDAIRHRARGRALMFASAVSFGLAALLVRVAAGRGMSGGQVAAVRFAVGLASVVALFRVRRGTFQPGRYGLLAVRGAVGGAAVLLYFLALARISAGEATLLNNLFPIFAVGISIITLGERPTLHLALALLLASAGVFLVLGGGGIRLGLGWGQAFGILSGLAGGVAVTSIRALRSSARAINAPTIFFAFSLGGVLVCAPFAWTAWTADPWAWAAALATGVAAAAAQLAMTEAYGALSVPEAAVWQQLTPISAYAWGLLAGEPFGGATVLGVLLGITGVVYGSLLGHRPGARASEAARVPVLPGEE
jgi:drug/metabolite transporter (DMT)-like permease